MSYEEKDILEDMRDRIVKIEHYLYNDGDTGKSGIIKAFEVLNKRVYVLEEKEKIQKAKASVWGGILGAGVVGIIEILKLIFK